MKLSVITLTGFRPDALKLCDKYFNRQTIHKYPLIKIQRIVVHDQIEDPKIEGLSIYKSSFIEEIYIPRKVDNINQKTFNINLEIALDYCDGDVVCFMEDDDWYDETYLEWIVSNFKKRNNAFTMALGESHSKYYNLKWRKSNERTYPDYTSLAQTSFDAQLIPHLKYILKTYRDNIDMHFWKTLPKLTIRNLQSNIYNKVIGIKGMPGRNGIGRGHLKIEQYNWFKDDSNLTDLINYVGREDAEAYINIMKFYKENGIK